MNLMEVTQKLTAGELAGWAVVLIILLFSLIQISPLKLNPWDRLLGWIGSKLNSSTEKRFATVETQLRSMWINDHRLRTKRR